MNTKTTFCAIAVLLGLAAAGNNASADTETKVGQWNISHSEGFYTSLKQELKRDGIDADSFVFQIFCAIDNNISASFAWPITMIKGYEKSNEEFLPSGYIVYMLDQDKSDLKELNWKVDFSIADFAFALDLELGGYGDPDVEDFLYPTKSTENDDEVYSFIDSLRAHSSPVVATGGLMAERKAGSRELSVTQKNVATLAAPVNLKDFSEAFETACGWHKDFPKTIGAYKP